MKCSHQPPFLFLPSINHQQLPAGSSSDKNCQVFSAFICSATESREHFPKKRSRSNLSNHLIMQLLMSLSLQHPRAYHFCIRHSTNCSAPTYCTHGEGLVNWWASSLTLLCRGLIYESLSLEMLVENKSSLMSNIQGKSTSFGIVDGTGDWDTSEIRIFMALVYHEIIHKILSGLRWTPSPLYSSSPAPKR